MRYEHFAIETEGQKDKSKMAAFVHAVRKEERL